MSKTTAECPDCGCQDLLTLRTLRRPAKAIQQVRLECNHCSRQFVVKVDETKQEDPRR